MTAIDVLRSRLGLAAAEQPLRKTSRPRAVALIDVDACTGCGLCVPACPAACIEALVDSPPDRTSAPAVQVRHDECLGCGLCVEICTHLAHVSAIRSYDTNLVEQALGCDIAAQAPLAPTSPEPGNEYWAEEGAFHHMGEGARIQVADLSPEERTALAAGAR